MCKKIYSTIRKVLSYKEHVKYESPIYYGRKIIASVQTDRVKHDTRRTKWSLQCMWHFALLKPQNFAEKQSSPKTSGPKTLASEMLAGPVHWTIEFPDITYIMKEISQILVVIPLYWMKSFSGRLSKWMKAAYLFYLKSLFSFFCLFLPPFSLLPFLFLPLFL